MGRRRKEWCMGSLGWVHAEEEARAKSEDKFGRDRKNTYSDDRYEASFSFLFPSLDSYSSS